MYFVTVKDGRINKFVITDDPLKGDIFVTSHEFFMLKACNGNIDNGINALVKVAEKILAETLKAEKAVIFPERAPLEVGDKVVVTDGKHCNGDFQDGTIGFIEMIPATHRKKESIRVNDGNDWWYCCPKCISRA